MAVNLAIDEGIDGVAGNAPVGGVFWWHWINPIMPTARCVG